MVFDLLDRLFNRTKDASGSVAKDRLKMVLAVDRTNLSPQVMDKMRTEILAVVSKYFELEDLEGLEVSLERDKNSTALIANVPIRRVKAVDV